MSAYTEQVTEFKDAELLLESLKTLGMTDVQFHKQPVQLEGYHGDKREQTAEIVIPRHAVGFASNDIGFKRQANGSYAAIISDYDSSKYNAAWNKRLKVAYAEAGSMRQAKKAGLRFVGKKIVNGKIQLQFLKA